jgi:hypothetical protein
VQIIPHFWVIYYKIFSLGPADKHADMGWNCMSTGIKPLGLGLTAGIIWAFGILILGLMATFFNWGNAMVSVFGSLYIGYGASLWGSIIGMIWAFFDGFIGGAVFAFVYIVIVERIK